MEDLVAAFIELFPISSELFSLEFVPEYVNENTGEVFGGVQEFSQGQLVATIRLVVWEEQDGTRSIRDIKEQQVVWLGERHREDPRLRAYIEGWAQAVRHVFTRHDERVAAGDPSDKIECAMPHDFLCPDVLDLRRPQTADDFTEMLLSGKKRLGGLLP